MKKLTIIIVAIGVVIAITSVFLSAQKRGPSQQTIQSVPAIQGTTGLNAAAAELDKIDLSGLDKELNLLNTDTSKF